MNMYLVRRLGVAANASELDSALMRLRGSADRPAPRCRVLCSYALRESDGRLGLACLVESPGVLDVHQHAWASTLPIDEVVRVTATRVERPFAPALMYLVRRRSGWADRAAFERSVVAARRECAGRLGQRATWIHSHAVLERDGRLGSCCFYQAVSADALREHARRAGLPAHAIVAVLGRVVFEPAAASPPPVAAPSRDDVATRGPG